MLRLLNIDYVNACKELFKLAKDDDEEDEVNQS